MFQWFYHSGWRWRYSSLDAVSAQSSKHPWCWAAKNKTVGAWEGVDLFQIYNLTMCLWSPRLYSNTTTLSPSNCCLVILNIDQLSSGLFQISFYGSNFHSEEIELVKISLFTGSLNVLVDPIYHLKISWIWAQSWGNKRVN